MSTDCTAVRLIATEATNNTGFALLALLLIATVTLYYVHSLHANRRTHKESIHAIID